MKYHSINDDKLLYIDSEDKENLYLGFSRVEDYALYKGLDRGIKKMKDYDIYAKM